MSIILKYAFVISLLAASSWNTRIQDHSGPQPVDSVSASPLISDTTTMQTAWDFVKNPLTDSLHCDAQHAEQIKRGFLLFIETPRYAPQFSGNRMTCSHCHLNAGQRSKALPIVGVAGKYPEYNKRAGRLFSLEDRIVECFNRGINATGAKKKLRSKKRQLGLSTQSSDVLALASYISWISEGYEPGEKIAWRGTNVIPHDKIIPVENLNPKIGRRLFNEKCTNCHGEDGQGVEIGDKKAGPLWGRNSWNDGAGAARVYTLAGMIRYMMPYLDPGSLSDEEAQQIAAFITSKPRPRYPFKSEDYRTENLPPDAVYYRPKK